MIAPTSRAVLGALSAFVLSTLPLAQASRPQPYAVTNVSLDRTGEDDARWTLILREGRIAAVQGADEALPAGVRVVDGEGLLALPSFVDAFTQMGVETPEPVKDQDVPADVTQDIRIDMREANRKGIQPAFRAVEAFAFEEDSARGWSEAGFGTALVAPSGELLAGSSVLAATREGAARDLVVRPEVFAHAAFAASGGGYPSTLMGYHAQLRQYFLDAQHHAEAAARHASGRAGVRPPWDAELEAAAPLLAGDARLVCEAQTSRDLERWVRLMDEFGVQVAISGGRDAWRRTDLLVERGIPVFLTLDWGDEVDDPLADEKEEDDSEGEAEEDAPEEGADETATDPDEEDADEDDEEKWIYDEPLGVRVEKRRLWEEKRDCAIRLHEAGVPFAFGSAAEKPNGLLENVRALVEAGLPADVALTALTTGAADLLGVGERLGKLETGYDATLTLWTADPMSDEKAKVAWSFVDGFPEEFEVEEGLDGAPGDGVDATGRWTIEVSAQGGSREATLVLEMNEDGSVKGTLTSTNPADDSKMESDVSGQVAGSDLRLDGQMATSQWSADFVIKGSLDGDSIDGKYIIKFGEQEMSMNFTGSRDPETRARR